MFGTNHETFLNCTPLCYVKLVKVGVGKNFDFFIFFRVFLGFPTHSSVQKKILLSINKRQFWTTQYLINLNNSTEIRGFLPCPGLSMFIHYRKIQMNNEKKNYMCFHFSYSKNMANFEAFGQLISLNINLNISVECRTKK